MTADFKLYPFRKYLAEHQITFAFRGVMTQEVLALIGLTLRNGEKNRILSRRLFSITVELAQNIYHYSAEREFVPSEEAHVGCGIIVITQSEDHYKVTSGNLVTPENKKNLVERCEYINSLSHESLLDYHRKQRRIHARLDSSSGANIGLIELVRRSGHPLEIHFFESLEDATKEFFTMSITLNKAQEVPKG